MRAVLPRRYRPEHAAPALEKAQPRRILRRSALLADPEPETSVIDDLNDLEAQDAEQERRDADDPHLTRQFPAIPDDETWPTPDEGSYPYEPTDPREEAARLLTAPETPTLAEMRRLLDALRAWEPEGPHEASGPRRLTFTAPQDALRAPGGADLVSFHAQERAIVARLDGMPERCVTPSGRPVLMLGVWPDIDGASFGIGGMSDAWLDALVFAAEEERAARRAVRVPTFTPHPAPEMNDGAEEAATQVIPNGVPDGARPAEDVPATDGAL